MNARKTIIVTGGMGYIGSHTIIELLEKTPFNIVSIDNFSNSSSETLRRIETITGKKITNYAIDICNKEALANVFETVKNIVGVIHFAAFKSVPESVANPFKYYSNNINSLLNMLEVCITHSIDNFIFSSSCSVYGNISQLPVNENTPLAKAESPYAHTKQLGEEIIANYSKTFPTLKSVALRYFNPVGAHMSGLIGENPINIPTSLVPIITKTAIGEIKQMTVHGTDYNTRDGSCIRDYIHVTDIANSHIKALNLLMNNEQRQQYSIINLGTGQGVSVLEAIHAFESCSQQKLNYVLGSKRPGDIEAIYSDTHLSSDLLQWTPQYNLNDMMTSAWKWQLHLNTL
jgi:UDP-glucose 4-epimerase